MIVDKDNLHAAAGVATADISSFLAGWTEVTSYPLCLSIKSVVGKYLISFVKLFGKSNIVVDDDDDCLQLSFNNRSPIFLSLSAIILLASRNSGEMVLLDSCR